MPGGHSYVAGMKATAPMTADELLRVHLPGKRVELVRGVLVVREAGGSRHGQVTMKLAAKLDQHARGTGAGTVIAADAGFTLARDPDTVRGPDIAFVSAARHPDPPPPGFPDFAPDLVVEVSSPDGRPGEMLARVADWLTAGTRLVWVVDAERRVARVYRQDGSESLLGRADALSGEDVVPGFSCPLVLVL